jgi:hypothetical protein
MIVLEFFIGLPAILLPEFLEGFFIGKIGNSFGFRLFLVSIDITIVLLLPSLAGFAATSNTKTEEYFCQNEYAYGLPVSDGG